MEKLLLNIQRFAEGETTEPTGEVETPTTNIEDEGSKELSFTDLLKKPEYQREFDKLVNKSINTAKTNWEKDYNAKLEAEKSEAEKLAKMDADQKMQYELQKERDEKEALQNELNSIKLYREASDIVASKELPIGYLDLIDFKSETAESIKSKIDKLEEIRQKDLQSYINNKLKQKTPEEKPDKSTTIDPYIEGFKSEY